MLKGTKAYVRNAINDLVVRPLSERLAHVIAQNDHLAYQFNELMHHLKPVGRFDPLNEDKRDLIDYICKMFPFESFADLGGAWTEPRGGFSLYTMERHQIPTGFLVDSYGPDELRAEVEKHPGLQFIQADFGSPEVAGRIGEVDVIFLFDVLLVQANPDWDQILEMYAGRTKCFLVSNVQFNVFPRTVRLMDMGKEEYFKCVPYTEEDEAVRGLFEKLDEIHPQFQRTYRDCPCFWQWGITDDDLIGKMKSLGFRMHYFKTMFQRSDIQADAESRGFVFLREPIRIFPYR